MADNAASYGDNSADPIRKKLLDTLPLPVGFGLTCIGWVAVIALGPAGALITAVGLGGVVLGGIRSNNRVKQREQATYELPEQETLSKLCAQLKEEGHVLIARILVKGKTKDFFVSDPSQTLKGVPRRDIKTYEEILSLADKDETGKPVIAFLGRPL